MLQSNEPTSHREAALQASLTDVRRQLSDVTERERRYRSLVSNVAGMIYRVEAAPPWRLLYVSDGVESLTGYPPEHFVEHGHSWGSMMLPEDAKSITIELACQAASGRPLKVEYRVRHRDGSIRWLEGRVRAVEGEVDLFEGTAFDIDERKRAEQALQESQEHFRYTTQTVPGVLWTAQPDGTFSFVSDAALEVLGIPAEQMRQEGSRRLVHPEDIDRVLATWKQSRETGALHNISYRSRRPGGEYRTIQSRARPRRDQNGHVISWYGITTDVDDLVQIEARLRDSEQRLRATIQAVPGLTWTATPDGAIDFVSDASRRLFGLEPEALRESGWVRVLHAEHAAVAQTAWRDAVAAGMPYQADALMLGAEGQYRWVSVRATPEFSSDGQVEHWYGFATDIHDVKLAQARAEEGSRAKSAFLSTMSHEIRTPLNAVLGFSGLLADTQLGRQQRDFVNSIRASGDHLLSVINDILDFSKLESGSLSLELVPCNLRETIEASLDLVASQAAPKNLELLYRIDVDVPASCRVDRTRLRQVLVNLLSNAVKFTLEGEVVVTLSARAGPNDRYELEFCVNDTGIGISIEGLERLFRDFSQVDDSVSRRFGGTGLGLAISKRLVEAHGGTFSVESQPGVGSRFIFRIAAQASEPPPTLPPASLESLRGRRILIVDDNRSNLEILEVQLRSWGMDSVSVHDPALATMVLRETLKRGQHFDLAILDHAMPAIDGVTLATQLRLLSPFPLMLLTSLGTTQEQVRADGADFFAVQSKPLHRSALFEALNAVFAPRVALEVNETSETVIVPPLRLLVAEDNVVNRKLATLLLRKIGYKTFDVAVDGLEAVRAVESHDYDVVLMDVQMPNLDGLDATRRIRAEIDSSRQPYIVALTANAAVEDRDACLAAGMNDYLSKPIDPTLLLHSLLRAAEHRGVAVAPRAVARRGPAEDAEGRARRIADQVLAGGGEMGAVMRHIGWSQTPVGPVYTWPQSLRTTLSILLSSKHPMFLWWGEELIQFYNDAYRPILGATKHPKAMGQRGRECWSEIWDVIGPMCDAVMQRGESTVAVRSQLFLFRNGFHEETYFTYSYSPIRDESGGIGGIFAACSENTAEVVSARRNTLLLDIARVSHNPQSEDERWSGIRIRLEQACNDLPFVLVYRFSAATRVAELVFAGGLNAGSDFAPNRIIGSDSRWPLFDDLTAGRLVLNNLTDLPIVAPWPEAPNRAVVVPLGDWGVMIAGTSPRLPLDADYLDFLSLAAEQITFAGRVTGSTPAFN